MYDVRLTVDSVFERIAKAAHFGVMIGLAVTGPRFASAKKVIGSAESPFHEYGRDRAEDLGG